MEISLMTLFETSVVLIDTEDEIFQTEIKSNG